MYTKISSLTLIFLFIGLMLGREAEADTGQEFFHMERSIETDKDLQLTSIGGFGLADGVVGHADLSYIESVGDGDGLAIDMGAGISYRMGATFFLGAGVLFGYNWDSNDYIRAYYPEAGIVIQITDSFALTLTGKRYYNLASTNDDENVVMFGLLFGGD